MLLPQKNQKQQVQQRKKVKIIKRLVGSVRSQLARQTSFARLVTCARIPITIDAPGLKVVKSVLGRCAPSADGTSTGTNTKKLSNASPKVSISIDLELMTGSCADVLTCVWKNQTRLSLLLAMWCRLMSSRSKLGATFQTAMLCKSATLRHSLALSRLSSSTGATGEYGKTAFDSASQPIISTRQPMLSDICLDMISTRD